MANCSSSSCGGNLLSSLNSTLLKRGYLKSKVPGAQSQKSDSELDFTHSAKEDIFSRSQLFSNVKTMATQVETATGTPCSPDVLLDRLLIEAQQNVTAITHNIRLNTRQQVKSSEHVLDEFSCQKCCELLYNPVTLLCGHTFCQHCVEIFGKIISSCVICNKPLPKQSPFFRGNIVLSTVIQKWHPTEWLSRSHTIKGITHLANREYQSAVECFTKTLAASPRSHVAYLHRAKANLCLDNLNDAYQDIWMASYLASTWPEVYSIYGEILFAMRHFEEAVLSFCICLSFDPKHENARTRVREILLYLLSDNDSPSRPASPLNDYPFSGKRRHDSDNNDFIPKKRKYCPAAGSVARIATLIQDSMARKSEEEKASQEENVTQCSLYVHPTIAFDKNFTSEGLSNEDPNSDDEENVHRLKKSLLSIASSLTEVFFINAAKGNGENWTGLMNLQTPVVSRKVNPELLDATDFECSLCMRLFYDPVCTPCGHIFCQFCIERCLDHKAHCPLCKCSMKEYLADSMERIHPASDYVTKNIIRQYFPDDYKEREEQHKQEIKEITQSKPIFVCTIAFPSVPCPLHVFEPRYRLMLRRCLDHNQREFGMCMPAESRPHHPIGTLLKVRDVKFFPDGRSVVDGIGLRRFKATDCQVKDGYNVAKYEYIIDRKVTESNALANLLQLADKVYGLAEQWFRKLPESVRNRITTHFGSFPSMDEAINEENGPDWLWWVLAVLPVEEKVQATILGKDVLRERLLIIQRILGCLEQRNKRAAA